MYMLVTWPHSPMHGCQLTIFTILKISTVPIDSTEMGSIKDYIENLIMNVDSVNKCNVSFRDIDANLIKENWKGW